MSKNEHTGEMRGIAMEVYIETMRKLGIALIEPVPWGTHLSAIYVTINDLVDLVVPYLTMGLESNEYCLWIVPESLPRQQAYEILQKCVPNFEQYQTSIEIHSCQNWYMPNGVFDRTSACQSLMGKLDKAVQHGYEGLRVCNSLYWQNRRNWKKMIDYLQVAETLTKDAHVIALYTLALTDCEMYQLLDLISSKQIALIKCSEKWKHTDKVLELNMLNNVASMAAEIVHEVRNPMSTVIALMQLLQSKRELSQYKQLFSTIVDELHRANGIISEYLSMVSRRESVLQKQNLNYLLQSMLPLIQAEAHRDKKEIRLQTEKIPDIVCDPKEIRQVILNLVRNGLEAMRNQGILDIRTYSDADQVILEISDHGCGIPQQMLNQLGQPFVTTKEDGTGLGLYVSYKILEKYNAKVQVESSENGTTFRIAFPLPHELTSSLTE